MSYDRDRILANVDLSVLADELLGAHKGSRTPTWPCPEETHAQTGRTPPVTVFTTRRGEQRWTCHGCGASGTAIDLVMTTQRVDVRGALEWLSSRAGVAADRDRASTPASARARTVREEPPASPDPGLDDYVAGCERWLWSGQGANARAWLTRTRGLPPDLLRHNRIGFDPGSRRLDRPDGVPRAAGVVLPVLDVDGRAVFTQTRRLHPRDDDPRYLNCAARAAPNPRLALYRSGTSTGACVVVCEGALDALSAATAGRRSAAVLGAALADAHVADKLADLDAPLAIAFDADAAGDTGARRLQGLLRERGRVALRLRPPASHGDLNAWMTASPDWEQTFASALRSCFCMRDQSVTLEPAR